jgi:hypothetical protein
LLPELWLCRIRRRRRQQTVVQMKPKKRLRKPHPNLCFQCLFDAQELHRDKTSAKGRSGIRRWLYDCLHVCIHEHLCSLDLRLVLDFAGKSHSHSHSRVQYDQYIQEIPRMRLWISLSVHSTPLPLPSCIAVHFRRRASSSHFSILGYTPIGLLISHFASNFPSGVSCTRKASWWACGCHGNRCRFHPCSPNKVAHILFRPVLPRGFFDLLRHSVFESAVAQFLVGNRSIAAGYEAIIPLPAKLRLASPPR